MKKHSNKTKTKDATRRETFSFPSMDNASARTGIPKRIFQKLKADGHPGFRHSRIYLDVVKAFADSVFKTDAQAQPNWTEVGKEYAAKLAQFAYEEKCRNVISLEEAQQCIQDLMTVCMGAVKRMAIEFPKTLEMRSAIEIKAACDTTYREILNQARAEIATMQSTYTPPANARD